MSSRNRLRVLEEVPSEAPTLVQAPTPTAAAPASSDETPPAAARIDHAEFLKLALGVLTKRLVDGGFAFTALVLGWWIIPVAPTWQQLAAVALYGVLALAILVVRR